MSKVRRRTQPLSCSRHKRNGCRAKAQVALPTMMSGLHGCLHADVAWVGSGEKEGESFQVCFSAAQCWLGTVAEQGLAWSASTSICPVPICMQDLGLVGSQKARSLVVGPDAAPKPDRNRSTIFQSRNLSHPMAIYGPKWQVVWVFPGYMGQVPATAPVQRHEGSRLSERVWCSEHGATTVVHTRCEQLFASLRLTENTFSTPRRSRADVTNYEYCAGACETLIICITSVAQSGAARAIVVDVGVAPYSHL